MTVHVYVLNIERKKKMRPEDRIDRICEKLREAWHKVPDWRIGQLLDNILGVNDPFYVEDTETEKALDRFNRGSK